MAKGKSMYAPNEDAAAEFAFYPSAKTRKKFPNAELEYLQMDLQAGELLVLAPESEGMVKGTLALELPEGRVELLNFDGDWQKIGSAGDAIAWTIQQIIEAWSSDE